MYLERVSARNFLTFGPTGVDFDPRKDLTTVVGPNGAGKTNIFRAVDFVIAALASPQQVDAYRHRGPGAGELRIRLTVKFTAQEAEVLGQFFELSVWSRNFNPGAGSGFDQDADQAEATRLSNLFVASLKPVFEQIFSGKVIFCAEGTGDPTSPTEAWIEIETTRGWLYLRNNPGGLTLASGQTTGWTPLDVRNMTLHVARRMFPYAVKPGPNPKRLTDAEIEQVTSKLNMEWFLDQFEEKVSTPRLLLLEPVDIRVHLVGVPGLPGVARSFFAGLAARGWYDPGISLRNLLALILRTSIVRLSNWRSAPSDEPAPEFHLIPTKYGLVTGAELPAALWRLRDSSDPANRDRFELVRSTYEAFNPGERLEVVLETHQLSVEAEPSQVLVQQNQLVVAPPSPTLRNYQLPVLRFRSGDLEVPVENLSAGKYEVLLVIFASVGNAGSVVFLDEPATNLHPARQRDLSELLISKAKAAGIQLVIVTHSPWFVSPRHLDGLVRIHIEAGVSVVRYLAPKAGRSAARYVRAVTRYPAIIRLLFARRVILFEGATEAAALPTWFGKLSGGLDESLFEIDSHTVDGDGTFRHYAPTLKRLGVEFCVIGDKKAKARLRGILSRAILFPQDDFSLVIEKECQNEYRAALRQLNPRKKSKSPELCRLVARLAPPPPSVVQVWKRVEAFLR